jgi:hypothetical protein
LQSEANEIERETKDPEYFDDFHAEAKEGTTKQKSEGEERSTDSEEDVPKVIL